MPTEEEWQRRTAPLSDQLSWLSADIHQIALDHGFWTKFQRSDPDTWFAEKAMLVVSELAEALDALRTVETDELRIEDMQEEIADTIIRCLDMAQMLHIVHGATDIGRKILTKVETNRNRPMHHGKRF